jgi:signal transduction histidine kinase
MTGRSLAPLGAAGIGLAGALAATLSLHHAASTAVEHVLEERLAGAGEAAAALLANASPTPGQLREVMRANGLDGVYVVNRALRVAADGSGTAGRRADLLRFDLSRLEAAFKGRASIAPGFHLGSLTVMSGYFPVLDGGGVVESVLVLEAGQTFVAARAGIARGRILGVSLSLLSALGLAVAAVRWSRAERDRRNSAVRAAQGEALSRVAAMAAHEIRNPLGVIRGTIDLMRERSIAMLTERDQQALHDIGDEVERLRRLTEDLVDLAADRPLAKTATSIADVVAEAARATEAMFPGLRVRCEVEASPTLDVDPVRLRQVFANLFTNAAQAQREGEIFVRATSDRRAVRILVKDQGPGIPAEVAERLFDLFFTAKSGGTGLGLAIARRLVERHGGTLVHLREQVPGTTFEVALPLTPLARAHAEGG